jgi:hypothetical protein
MDRIAGLHTIARRHCIERHGHWIEAYRRLDASDRARKRVDVLKWDYTAEAYATFPRYLVWHAILDESNALPDHSLQALNDVENTHSAPSRAAARLTDSAAQL